MKVVRDKNILFVQTDIFSYLPIYILQKPSLLRPFRNWKIMVDGEEYEFPSSYKERDIIHELLRAGKIHINHFNVFDFCGYRVLSSEKEGTYVYSPYSRETYFISNKFVKHKIEVAEEVLENIWRIPEKGERDKIYLCAKKVLKHPTELQLVYQA